MGRIDLLFELERTKQPPPPKPKPREKPRPPPPPCGRPPSRPLLPTPPPPPFSDSPPPPPTQIPYCASLPPRQPPPPQQPRLPQLPRPRPPPADDAHVTEIYKDYNLYLAAKNGNRNDFERLLNRVSAAEQTSFHDILSRVSPAGNTFVHVAAKHGNEDIVRFIAEPERKPSLVLSKNFKGETSLHVAAKAGDKAMVEVLVRIHHDLLDSQPLYEDQADENNLLRAKNKKGNTALHEALLNGRDQIAKYLIEQDFELSYYDSDEDSEVSYYDSDEDSEVSYYDSEDRESVLYLAAKAGCVDCVSEILELSTNQNRLNKLFSWKSPIQAAIQGKQRDVLEAVFHFLEKNKNEAVFQTNPHLRDGEGRNPLHYAASLGYLEEVRYLLKKNAHSVTQMDKSGLFPIHLASIEGHVDVVRFLLPHCPDPGELLDKDDRNILHVAAMHGKSNVVNFILKNPDLEDLINMEDKKGNTPLHLAAKHFHPKIVNALTWDKRVDIKVVNDKGKTALDAALDAASYSTKFYELLTWAALKAAGTPRYFSGKTRGRKNSSNMDNYYKDMVNTLLVVSTLVATVTFAAGFTVPGGYNSSEFDAGMAIMIREKGFHVFVFCDTIAMYSSIVVAVALIWAQFHDLTIALNALTLAVPLLGIALTMMSMAFAAGLSIAVSKLWWLSIAVLVMGITFLVILFLLILPLCTPLTSSNRILRYISYYPFCLLILASSKSLVA